VIFIAIRPLADSEGGAAGEFRQGQVADGPVFSLHFNARPQRRVATGKGRR
jgi:hypothetical protein